MQRNWKDLPAVLGIFALLILLAWFAATQPQADTERPDESGETFHSHKAPDRSGKWRKTRADHLVEHPDCAVCRAVHPSIQVHHVKDFARNPELENDPTNLLTLCGPEGCNAHHWLAHPTGWKKSNPHVREDAALMRLRYDAARKQE